MLARKMAWARCGLATICLFMLPALAGATTVHTVSELQTAVNAANTGGDTTIIIAADGSPYNLNGTYFRITADGVTVAGETGTATDVVLDGQYITTEIFQIAGGSNVTIKNLTAKRAVYHPIHIFPVDGNVVGTLIDNVVIIDPGQQAIKVNQDAAQTWSVNNGILRNSRIELTDAGRVKVWAINGSCYTGGVDMHHATGWTVAGNEVEGFWCEGGLSEHGIHFWKSCQDIVVEKNLIINCDRGIGFGLGTSTHQGGIIRNNMLYHDAGHTYSDVGIGLESASDVQVYNNTIYHEHSYANAIEYRFTATTGAQIYNNLTNKAIASRDGGSGEVSHNVTTAQASYFTDYTSGDLHLAYAVPGVVNNGMVVGGLVDDFDGDTRGTVIDIGADQFLQSSQKTVGKGLPWLLLLLNE